MNDTVLDKIFKVKIKKLFLSIIDDDDRIYKIIQDLKSISKEKLGKSGAQVFYYDDNIIKMYPVVKLNYRISKDGKCIHISNILNEMIINFVFNNMDLFLTKKSYNLFSESGFEKYFIRVDGFGFYYPKHKSYIIQQKIGYNSCITLYDLIKNIDNIDNIIPKMEKYFEVLKFLNKKLGFFHTDLTCKNVFLKKYRGSYICTISDLDKGVIKLGGVDIFPSENSLADKLGQSEYLKPFKNIYQFRYKCQRKPNFCDRFEPYHYDRITLLMDVYILVTKTKGIEITPKLEKFISSQLSLDNYEFELFVESIKDNYFLMKQRNNNLGFHINYSMYKFCKLLMKNK